MQSAFLKNIFFILLLLAFNIGYAQFFGLIYKDPAQYYGNVLNQSSDGKYRVVNFRKPDASGHTNPNQILIYNQNLQFEDSINLLNGASPIFHQPLKVGNKFLWPAGLWDTVSNNLYSQRLIILELDSVYHHIAAHEISYFENQPLFLSNLLYFNNHYYVSKNGPFGGNCKIYKLNNQFLKVDSIYYPNAWVQQILNVNNNLFVTGFALPSPCQGGNLLEKLILDTNLNSISCNSLVALGATNWQTRILPISKTKYILAGTAMTTFSSFAIYDIITNTIFDNNDQIIQSHFIQNTNQHTSYIDYSTFAAHQQNEIITVACIGHDPSMPSPQAQHTFIYVNKLDTLGNIVWQKNFGGDMYYRPHSIAFTSDGGCIISGLRYDTAHAVYPGIMESFLLKLDWYGNISGVGIFENSKINDSPIKYFPNPAANELFFDLPFQEAIEIKLLDIFAKEVLTIKNYNNLSSIDISHFAKGLYLYQIKTKNKTYSGKFMRE